MEIRTNGIQRYNEYTYLQIELIKTLDIFEDKENLDFKEEDREQIETVKMGDIVGKVRIVDFKRLEGLEEGLELIISNISVINCRGKERFLLKSENIVGCYCSNYWLEEELQDKDRDADLNFKILIKMDKIKNTQ